MSCRITISYDGTTLLRYRNSSGAGIELVPFLIRRKNMTAQGKRSAVAAKYAILIGRNYYDQNIRDYCFKKYKDGNYYSDCSSSICYAYKEAGQGFGILNTAGIYQSSKLTTVDAAIKAGMPAIAALRVGDMLEFAGTDSSRPQRIGHVEMVYSINGGKVTLCGHGSGRPSYKDMAAYCKSRYDSWAPGGWRKGLVCVRRYIQDDAAPVVPEEPKKSGWYAEDGGYRCYLGNTGECVRNAWYQDVDSQWYWFDAAGVMISNTWYQYQGSWFYMGTDGAMVKGLQDIGGKWYYLDDEGRMAVEPVTLTPDADGALRYPGLAG